MNESSNWGAIIHPFKERVKGQGQPCPQKEETDSLQEIQTPREYARAVVGLWKNAHADDKAVRAVERVLSRPSMGKNAEEQVAAWLKTVEGEVNGASAARYKELAIYDRLKNMQAPYGVEANKHLAALPREFFEATLLKHTGTPLEGDVLWHQELPAIHSQKQYRKYLAEALLSTGEEQQQVKQAKRSLVNSKEEHASKWVENCLQNAGIPLARYASFWDAQSYDALPHNPPKNPEKVRACGRAC